MNAIAEEADVAVQTLYFTFHTKVAILDEAVGAAILGFERWVPPDGRVRVGDPATLRVAHEWFTRFEHERTSKRALELFVAEGVEIMERVAPLLTTVREASGDPDARAVAEIGEARRVESYEAIVRVIAKKPGGLRDGLTIRRATDLLLTLFSAEVYQLLRTRGWKPRELRTWLLDLLTQQLLGRS